MSAPILRQPLPAMQQEKLKKALHRKIWLPSGAYLVIDHTEAMTVIDVNSGKYTAKGDLFETMRKLNLEAVREVARQIRLRDVGGIIVIDLIDMRDEMDREAVLEAFVETARFDRAKLHVHGFSPAGMLELTRRSVYRPFIQSRCSRCQGTGVEPDWDKEAKDHD
jgi:ribonuclease G